MYKTEESLIPKYKISIKIFAISWNKDYLLGIIDIHFERWTTTVSKNEINNDEYSIFCDQNILHDLSEKISKKYGKINQASLIWKSENTISIEKDNADKLFKLLNVLEESDDVQFVSSNFEVSDEVLSSLTV